MARPWVEVVSNVQGPPNMNRNLVTLPAQGRGVTNLGNSATFQRLGMKASQRGMPSLEVSHLETKPLSPVDIEENVEDDFQKEEEKSNNKREKTKFQRVKKVLSPASAEVLARRDSVRSKMGSQRMSRKTLQFLSPDMSNADPGNLLSIPQETRRSGRQRVELGNESVTWSRGSGAVSSRSEDEEVARTVIKKPKDQNPRSVLVSNNVQSHFILCHFRGEKRDKNVQHLSHISEKTNEVSVDVNQASALSYDRNVQGFDNPGYESQSVASDNCGVRESVISPPRRSSVIREPGSQESGLGLGERVSVISPPPNKVGRQELV